jgi:hypothetical protein
VQRLPCSEVLQRRSPNALGGLQIPRWLGSDPLSAWWLGLAQATLEFWVRFPNERNQGERLLVTWLNELQAAADWRGIATLEREALALARDVPGVDPGLACVMGRLIHAGLGSSSLIAHVLHSPPPPREQLCNRSLQ